MGRKFAASGDVVLANVLAAGGPSHGVARSTDAGRSWRVLDAVEPGSSGRLAADPTDAGRAFLATDTLGGLGGRLLMLPDALAGTATPTSGENRDGEVHRAADFGAGGFVRRSTNMASRSTSDDRAGPSA